MATQAPMPDLTPEHYVSERIEQYRSWYDKKAVQAKTRYLWMRAFSVIGGGLVPALVNTDIQIGGFAVSKLLVTVISLFVVVFVSLESVFHYREQWKNYRSTEQLLGHELYRYRAGIRPYQELDGRTAFLLLVERVEEAISAENTATLNVMTLAAETLDDSQKRRSASGG